jgi:hypothetical protein
LDLFFSPQNSPRLFEDARLDKIGWSDRLTYVVKVEGSSFRAQIVDDRASPHVLRTRDVERVAVEMRWSPSPFLTSPSSAAAAAAAHHHHRYF